MPDIAALNAAVAATRPVEISCGEGQKPITAQVDFAKCSGRIMQRLTSGNEPDEIGLAITFLAQVIVSWDATRNKKPVPTDEESFGGMGLPVLLHIVNCIAGSIGEGN